MGRRCRWALAVTFGCVLLGAPAAAQKSLYAEEPLPEAVRNSDTPAVVRALLKGESPNQRTLAGIPVVAVAAQLGDVETVKALLAHGAQADLADNDGNAALAHAAWSGNTTVVRLLLAAKPAPRLDRDNRQGETPLLLAAKGGRYDVAALLIKAGADVNATDYAGHTALWHARNNRHNRVVRLLQENGGKD
jgi:uncharacterized protein